MADGLFYKIIREGKQMHRAFFVPFLNGEPFVFPRIWDWLDYMLVEGVRVHVYTNAEFVDPGRLLKYPNVSCICCSLNAATADTYDKVMNGPRYETALAHTDQLVAGGGRRVWVSMVVTDDNQHEVDLFRQRWGERAIFGEFKNWGGARHCAIERTGPRGPCWPLLHTMNILWDGRVVPCCMDYDAKLVLGDANTESLTAIWHRAYWLRRASRKLDFGMIPCRDCNHNVL